MSNSIPSFFTEVACAPPDIIFNLTASFKQDKNPSKVNLGVGAYRDDKGRPWVLPVVKKAEQSIVNDPSLDHEYLPIAGLTSFTSAAAKLILGADSIALKEDRTATLQSVSGTGALYLGARFLAKWYRKDAICLLSDPTWANHAAIFNNVGIQTKSYTYYNPETLGLNIKGMLESLRNAPNGSIVVLHACAHNPTGVDPTTEQWKEIADVMLDKQHFPFFDCAYQGFASGDLNKDAEAICYFVERGFEMFIAQSFAKNLGLYGERCGAVTAVCKTPQLRDAVASQLSIATRSTISNPPTYGARVASLILNDTNLFSEWVENLQTMSNRISSMRQQLYNELKRLGTPGTWEHIINQIGMFSFTGLKATQVHALKEKYHVYMTDNGRISMAGLNSGNVEYFAKAMDDVVRNVK